MLYIMLYIILYIAYQIDSRIGWAKTTTLVSRAFDSLFFVIYKTGSLGCTAAAGSTMAGGKPTGIKNHGPQPLLIGLKHIMHSLRFYSPKPPTTLCKQPRKPGTKITQNQMVIIFHLKLAKTPMSRPPNITVLIFLCPMNYSILSLLYQHLKMFKPFILTQLILHNPEPVPGPTTCGAKSSLLLSQRAAPLADMLRRTQWRPHCGGQWWAWQMAASPTARPVVAGKKPWENEQKGAHHFYRSSWLEGSIGKAYQESQN
jgi:hypothetical protein